MKQWLSTVRCEFVSKTRRKTRYLHINDMGICIVYKRLITAVVPMVNLLSMKKTFESTFTTKFILPESSISIKCNIFTPNNIHLRRTIVGSGTTIQVSHYRDTDPILIYKISRCWYSWDNIVDHGIISNK